MAHANARLTPRSRLDLVREVEAGWSMAEAARRFRVARATVKKWVERFRSEGLAGLQDRSSRPYRQPNRTAPEVEARVRAMRRATGFGPHRIGWALGLPHQTIYAVLRRAGLNRLDRLHRVTREIVRYERRRSGELIHIDVKKSGRVPEGGGKRFAPGFAETQSGPHSKRSLGSDCLHVAVDDHSRYAYVEQHPDERARDGSGDDPDVGVAGQRGDDGGQGAVVVPVAMGGEHLAELGGAVLLAEQLQDALGVVGRVDQEALTGHGAGDEVDVVVHLGDRDLADPGGAEIDRPAGATGLDVTGGLLGGAHSGSLRGSLPFILAMMLTP